MSDHDRIPRPRDLFPEVAAVLIQSRRGTYVLTRRLQAAIGHVPVWTAGACAGVAGTMLAALLFFLTDPKVEAASESIVEIEPTLAAPVDEPVPTPVPTPAPIASMEQPELKLWLDRTALPVGWDPDRRVTSTSGASAALKTLQATAIAINDGWSSASGSRLPSGFQPYQPPTTSGDLISASPVSRDHLPPGQFPMDQLSMGLIVDKSAIDAVAGMEARYQIRLINNGPRIESLLVRERLPDLSRVTRVVPDASFDQGELVWTLGPLEQGAIRTFEVTIVPDQPGQLVTQTTVLPTSTVAASAFVQQRPVAPVEEPKPGTPRLLLSYTEVKGLQQGDDLSMIFSVSNVGTAEANDVRLFVRFSENFRHRYGDHVKHVIPRIEPGKTHRAILRATAENAGPGRLDTSLTMQGTEQESRIMTIPIQASPRDASRLLQPREQLSDRPSAEKLRPTGETPRSSSRPPVPSAAPFNKTQPSMWVAHGSRNSEVNAEP